MLDWEVKETVSDRPRSRAKAGHGEKGIGKSKESHLKNNRKIRKYNKMDVYKESVQNTANEHETRESRKAMKRKMQNVFCA